MTSGSFWNYYRDEINDDENENVNNNNRINKTVTSKSSEYKTKIVESMPNSNNILDTVVVVPLKYLSNFWRSLHFPLTNCQTKLELEWKKKWCIIWNIKSI